MLQEIDDILQKQGYQKIALNVPGLSFHLFRQEAEGYAVVSIDDTVASMVTKEEFLNISQQIREYLIKKDCRTNHFLYLFITNLPQSARQFFSEEDCYWVIWPAGRQLRIYENWDPFFAPLRAPLEHLFPAVPKADSGRKAARTHSGNFFPCTISLVVINVIIFLLTDLLGSVLHTDLWLELGAQSWQKIIWGHQYYRILTHMFLHGGLDHIFNNMLSLLFLGSYLENLIGTKRFTAIYFFSGILAGCTSMVYNMFQNTSVISIGASGAVFGLLGALLAVVILDQESRTNISGGRFILAILFSLYSGFASQGVDNAAHVGGFVAGMLITAILCLIERKDTKKCYE